MVTARTQTRLLWLTPARRGICASNSVRCPTDAMQAGEQHAPADPFVGDHRDEPAAFADLRQERGRHGLDRAEHQDDVERRLVGVPGARIGADDHHDVVGAELVEQRLDPGRPRPCPASAGSPCPPGGPARPRRSRWRSPAPAPRRRGRPARSGSCAPAPAARSGSGHPAGAGPRRRRRRLPATWARSARAAPRASLRSGRDPRSGSAEAGSRPC